MYEDTSVTAFDSNSYQTLGKKAFWHCLSQRIGWGIGFLVLAVVLAVVRVKLNASPEMAGIIQLASRACFGFAIVAFVVGYFVARFAWKSFTFSLSEDALRIRRGIMTQEEVAIPYRQIQNIEIQRTLSQRSMGLARLVILTAGQDNPNTKEENEGEAVLPSVDHEVALRLQTELLKRANVQKIMQIKK